MIKVSLKKQKGMGLLEALLALSIISVIVVLSMRYYEQYRRTSDIGKMQASIVELMDGLNAYYYMNCKNSWVANVTVKVLQDAGLVGKTLYNPWDNNQFSVSIFNTQDSNNLRDKFFMLKVSARINTSNAIRNTAIASFIRGALNGDAALAPNDTVVAWTRLPMKTRDDLSSGQWISQQGSGQAMMPGRMLTAVNARMDSKFWVLNGNLQQFTKLEDSNACPN